MKQPVEIIINRELSAEDHLMIKKMIVTLSERQPTRGVDIFSESWNFEVVTTKPIGGSYEGEAKPFYAELYTSKDYAELETDNYLDLEKVKSFQYLQDSISQYFSLLPMSRITVGSYTHYEVDQILGELALYLARTFEGVIDLGEERIFNLERRQMDYNSILWNFYFRPNWSVISDSTRIFIDAQPGHLLVIPTDLVENGSIYWKYICDTEFMAAWLKHPNFRLP
jgi:hypothetical protein